MGRSTVSYLDSYKLKELNFSLQGEVLKYNHLWADLIRPIEVLDSYPGGFIANLTMIQEYVEEDETVLEAVVNADYPDSVYPVFVVVDTSDYLKMVEDLAYEGIIKLDIPSRKERHVCVSDISGLHTSSGRKGYFSNSSKFTRHIIPFSQDKHLRRLPLYNQKNQQ